jgi:hypothetical protein
LLQCRRWRRRRGRVPKRRWRRVRVDSRRLGGGRRLVIFQHLFTPRHIRRLPESPQLLGNVSDRHRLWREGPQLRQWHDGGRQDPLMPTPCERDVHGRLLVSLNHKLPVDAQRAVGPARRRLLRFREARRRRRRWRERRDRRHRFWWDGSGRLRPLPHVLESNGVGFPREGRPRQHDVDAGRRRRRFGYPDFLSVLRGL